MTKDRIEAFSDGVIAIIITIMVLELKVPEGRDLAMLAPLLPIFLSHVLSFANVGLYWNNHHHMFHAVKHVGGWVLWANLHRLFWLSLLPFATGLMGENDFAPVTVAIYAVDLAMCAIAYTLPVFALPVFALPVFALLAEHGGNGDFARAIGSDRKGKISLACYIAAIPLTFVQPRVSLALIGIVVAICIVPDRRFSRAVDHG